MKKKKLKSNFLWNPTWSCNPSVFPQKLGYGSSQSYPITKNTFEPVALFRNSIILYASNYIHMPHKWIWLRKLMKTLLMYLTESLARLFDKSMLRLFDKRIGEQIRYFNELACQSAYIVLNNDRDDSNTPLIFLSFQNKNQE